jgi:hypothetical protein
MFHADRVRGVGAGGTGGQGRVVDGFGGGGGGCPSAIAIPSRSTAVAPIATIPRARTVTASKRFMFFLQVVDLTGGY